jgi:hypothetical protein
MKFKDIINEKESDKIRNVEYKYVGSDVIAYVTKMNVVSGKKETISAKGKTKEEAYSNLNKKN